jgi:hypothetical protein
MNTIEKVQETQSPGFYSRFFVVPKKAPGEWRAVLDLMALNQYIPAAKFKMETAESIRRDLNPREWTTSIDLKDAYMHVPIRPSFRKYLRFVVAGQAYQYKALPAGLSLAPWAFTRIIVAVKEFLHRLGINLHQFIDDWLIRALTEQLCACHTEVCLWLLWMLGFYHHPIKSQLVPTRDFIFLGYHYLLVQALLMPTPERWEKISAQIKLFQENQGLPAKQWQRLLGLMAATEKLVPQGLLHMRPIQLALRSAWSQSLQSQQTVVWISPEVRAAIHWWTDPLNVMVGVPLHPRPPQLTMYTDASVVGCSHWELPDFRHVVLTKPDVAHQFSGIGGCQTSPTPFPTGDSRKVGADSHRQHDSSGLHQPARRDEVHEPLPVDREIALLDSGPADICHSETLSQRDTSRAS